VNDATDNELLAAIARGDNEALAALYDRHAAVLFTLALHVLGGDRVRAEDLVHDIFLDLSRAARRHDPMLYHALRWLVLRIFDVSTGRRR
jgi:RNA polymerase sigma-70 factor (ECF subfamily)